MSEIISSKIALFLPSLGGGGAERVMLILAQGFVEKGFAVDLVLARAEGPYVSEVPSGVRIVNLNASRVARSFLGLMRYLRKEQPYVLLSALSHANILALLACKISGVSTKIVVSEHANVSRLSQTTASLRGRLMPVFIRFFYPLANTIVCVSNGVAEDLIKITKLSKEKVKVIYNPVVIPALFKKAQEPLNHPWFARGAPPVVLGVGRLTKQKDFPTLIRAFAKLRQVRQVRLVILGEGEDRSKLESLIQELRIEKDVILPGFVDNPFAYMNKSSVFVLSSICEALPTVLIEAMACGCPVVSTDCQSGPAEILENGKYGPLVPVGDVEALAQSILSVIDSPIDSELIRSRASLFSLENICNEYMKILLR